MKSASGSSGSPLQPFLVRSGGAITKLPKIEPPSLGAAVRRANLELTAKDVAIHCLYGCQVFVSIIAR